MDNFDKLGTICYIKRLHSMRKKIKWDNRESSGHNFMNLIEE